MLYTNTLTLKQNALTGERSRLSRPRKRCLSFGWTVGFVAGALGMGVAYLLTLNGQSTSGYQLKRFESEKVQLIQEIRALDSRIGELSSIGVIETAAQSMEFVAVDEVRYFVPETGVAAAGGAPQP